LQPVDFVESLKSEHIPAPLEVARKKVLFVLDHLPVRVQKINAMLADHFTIRSFNQGERFFNAMLSERPDVVLADERSLQVVGGDVYHAKVNSDLLKSISFVIMSDVQQGYIPSDDGHGATDCFLKRPIDTRQLIEELNTLALSTPEKSISKPTPKPMPMPMPKRSNPAICSWKKSHQDFDLIAKATANNTPLDKKLMIGRYNPLIDCIHDDQYEHVLNRLRGHHYATYAHSMRVAVMMYVFANTFDANKDETIALTTGGFIHDIGKLNIAPALLESSNASTITDQDLATLQDHVNQSCLILSSLNSVNPCAYLIVKQHQERLDGSGYPYGLKGLQINELGRMAAIADVFATLTAPCPDKSEPDTDSAIAYMQSSVPGLDQKLLRVFHKALKD